ncbi:MAG: hypothetical protein WC056_08625 [Bacteroidales bacterium]|jgi:uncharacterized protein YacL
MSDTYTMKTISEESIGMGTVTTTYQVPLCRSCEETYRKHKTKRIYVRIAAIVLGLLIVQSIASLFVKDSGNAFFIGIAGAIILSMIAARIYKVKYYPFRVDSSQHLHFNNKEYQQLFEQANPRV